MNLQILAVLQCLGVVFLAGAGRWSGGRAARLPGRWWLLGYVPPLAWVLVTGAASWYPQLEEWAGFRVLMAGRTEYAILALAVMMLLTAPLPRLPAPGQRRAVTSFAVFFTLVFSLGPFLLPAVMLKRHATLEAPVGWDGVCLQSTGYTCGPAAAVTAMHALGIEAREGDLAVGAFTSPTAGTAPDLLATAIRQLHGVEARQKFSGSLKDFPVHGPWIAVVRHSFLVDHYVVVFEVREDSVLLGDPLVGRVSWSREHFLERWRKRGVLMSGTD